MVSRVASMGTCTVTAQAVPGFHETNREAEVPVWNPRVVAWVQTNGSLPKVRTQTPDFVGWTMGSSLRHALMPGHGPGKKIGDLNKKRVVTVNGLRIRSFGGLYRL